MYGKQLYNYIVSSGIERIDDYIIANDLSLAFKYCLKDNLTIKAVNALIKKKNRTTNKAILNELKLLSDFIFANNINAVFVKGATIAYTVYDDPDDRNIGDIDVYVREEQIELLLEYLAELEYYDVTTGDKVQPILSIYKGEETHISPFVRNVEFDGKTVSVCIEIHLFPFFLNSQYHMFRTDEIYDAFFNSAVAKNIAGINLPVLPPNINFLFMLDHFVKHMRSSLEADIYEGNIENPIQLELLKLYEAKLYYEKYKDKINIESLVALAKKYNTQYPADLAIYYLNQVFPDTVKGFYADDENIKGHGLSEIIMCGEYRKYTLKDIIVQSRETKEALVKAIYLDYDYSSYTINVPYRKAGASRGHFEINHEKPCNSYGTHIMQGETYFSKDYSMACDLCWDKKYLYISTQITDAKFPETHGNILTFHIDNGKGKDDAGLKGFHVRINGDGNCDKNGNQYHLVDINDGERWLEAVNSECIFNFTTAKERGFSFFLALPWEMVNIYPETGNTVGFDVEFKRYEGDNLVSMSSLSCIRDTYRSKYGAKIILCE